MNEKAADLDRVIIQWINSFDSKPDADEYENSPIAPLHPTLSVPSDRVHGRSGGSVNVRFVQRAIGSHSNAEASVGEVVNESPNGNVSDGRNAQVCCARRKGTYLIAPAAVLGPNHCPTSLPRSLPTNAIR